MLRVIGTAPSAKREHDALIGFQLLEIREHVDQGSIVTALALPWQSIVTKLETDPAFLYQFVQAPEKFEEFIAASYELDGFSVTLTPRSGDRGRDVIAEKKGFGAIRILDQCKAFSKGRRVELNDVRAMIGVLSLDRGASKAVISTTSDFATGVTKSDEFRDLIPYRLELRNGEALTEWLKLIGKRE